MAGRVQGFGGRILSKKYKTGKYINSPESIIYIKSKVLYGIYESKKFIANQVNDKIGPILNTSANFDLSYHLRLNEA